MNKNKSFLSFNLNRGFNPPNLPIATFYQGDTELNFIIDTGSDNNVICSDIMPHIDHTILDGEDVFATAGGLQKVRKAKIKFRYGDEDFTSVFNVVDLKESFDKIHEWNAVRLHGMIGSNFLRENNIVLDFSNMEAYNKKKA